MSLLPVLEAEMTTCGMERKRQAGKMIESVSVKASHLGICQVMCCHWTEASCDESAQVTDKSIPFMPRTEVIDVRSGAHLGHVFNGVSLSSVV